MLDRIEQETIASNILQLSLESFSKESKFFCFESIVNSLLDFQIS